MSKVEANSISEIFSEAKKKLSSMSTDELQVENDTSDKLAFDVQKFIGMLQDQNRALAGLELFCNTARLQSDPNLSNDNNIVDKYLAASSDCKDIISYINVTKHGTDLATSACKALIAVLCQTAGTLRNRRSAGVKLAQFFVQTKISGVVRLLFTQNSDVIAMVFELFTILVMQGKDVGILLLKQLHFAQKPIAAILLGDKVHGNAVKKQAVRLGIIRFTVAYFLLNNGDLMNKILYTKGFVDIVLQQLQYENSAFCIHLLLTTILDKAIKSEVVSKAAKKALLSKKGVLASIAGLFEWNGMMDISADQNPSDDEVQDGVSTIHKLVYDFLHVVCCSPKHGIVFSLTFSDQSLPSHYLLRFLLEMKEKVASIPLLSTLAVQIFTRFPALLPHYFSSAALCFKPTSSAQWFNNCNLLREIYNNQPSVPAALQFVVENRKVVDEMPMQKQCEMILSGILPGVVDSDILTAIISYADDNVQMQGLTILSTSLLKLNSALEFLRKNVAERKLQLKQKYCKELSNFVQSSYKKRIPTLKKLMGVWKSICTENAITERETEMLKVLQLYQQVFLGSFDAGTFDFCDLLIGLSQVSSLEAGRKSILLLLDILLPSVHNYDWFSLKDMEKSPFALLLNFTLEMMRSSNDRALIGKALQLVTTIGKKNDLIKHADCDAEFAIWLRFLGLPADTGGTMDVDNESKSNDYRFFVMICSSVANNANRYLAKLQNLTKDCESSNHMTDASVQKWIESLPMVEMTRVASVTSGTVAAVESDLSESPPECPVSNLMIAAFDEIKNVDGSNWNIARLDRYLSSVLTTLFHRQILSGNSEQLTKALLLLFSEISNPCSFPLLSKCFQNIFAYSGALSFLDADLRFAIEVDCRDEDLDLPQFKSIVEGAALFLNSSAQDLPPSDDTNVECKVAGFLHHLAGLTVVMQCSKNEEANMMFGKLTSALQNFFVSIKVYKEGSRNNEVLKEGETCGDLKQQLGSSSSSFFVTKASYVVLLRTVLDSQLMKRVYLNKEITRARTLTFFNDFLTKILCDLLSFRHSVPSDYVEKLKSYVHEFLSESSNDTPSESIFDSFEQWINALSEQDIEEIFAKAASSISSSHCFGTCFNTMCKCLTVLLDRNYASYSAQFLEDLFRVLIDPVCGDKWPTLLALINRLLRDNPSLATSIPEQVTSWCMNRLGNDHVINLLQLLLAQNSTLRKYYLSLCNSDETFKLSSLKKSKRRLHLPLVAFLVSRSDSNEVGEDSLLLQVVAPFEQRLFSKLLDSYEELTDSEVSLLIWLIRSNHLTPKRRKKINKKLPTAFENDFQFLQRWKVMASYIKTLQNSDSTIEKTFRMKVASSLMMLCCALIESGKDSVVSSVAENLANVLQTLPRSTWEETAHLQLWQRFVASGLKFRLHDASILAAVTNLVKVTKCRVGNTVDSITAGQLHVMMTHHSRFLEVMMSGDEQLKNVKRNLLRLLYQVVVYCDPEQLKPSDFVYLLASYGATLSECDQILYQIMQLYEWKGIAANKLRPFFWGQPAATFYPSLNKKLQSLNEKPDPTKVLDCLSQETMLRTLKKFPIKRRMLLAERFDGKEAEELCNLQSETLSAEEECYDPAFLLNMLVTFLARDNRFNPLVILKSHLLPFLFRCLSSKCQHTRNLAARCLLLCEGHIDSTHLLMRDLVLALIRLVKASMILSDDGKLVKKHSSINTLYLSYAAMFLVQNDSALLKSVFIRLFNHPRMHMHVVPQFIPYFFSNARDHEQDRIWILELLSDGMRDAVDYRVAKASKVFPTMTSFFDSTLCTHKCRKLILEVIAKACRLREGVIDLLYRCSLLSWLQDVVGRQRYQLSIHRGSEETSLFDEIMAILVSIWDCVGQKQTEKGILGELMNFALPQLLALCIEIENCILSSTKNIDRSVNSSLQTLRKLLPVLRETAEIKA